MINYYLPTEVEIDNELFEIRSDFRAILDIIIALNDPDLSEQEKVYVSLKIFYKDYNNIKDIEKAYMKMIWFIDCGEDFKGYQNKPRVMDWEQDFNYIVPAINKTLGYECRSKEYLHWWSFIGAYQEIGECSFSNIVSIRNKLRKNEKLEKWEKEFYRNNVDVIKLKTKLSKEEQKLFDSIV